MQVERNKALRQYNSLDLDANADAFVNIHNERELLSALEWGKVHSIPIVATSVFDGAAGDSARIHVSTR